MPTISLSKFVFRGEAICFCICRYIRPLTPALSPAGGEGEFPGYMEIDVLHRK
jgi:hypothetical protein